MSELSGMRQLQQTVERLANRVSCAGASGDLQADKCSFLREQIQQLENEVATIDEKLLEHNTRVSSLLRQKDGKQFVDLSLELSADECRAVAQSFFKRHSASPLYAELMGTEALAGSDPESPPHHAGEDSRHHVA